MATISPLLYRHRRALLIPPYIVALPFVHDGWWWVADLSTDECAPMPVGSETLISWADRRGGLVEVRRAAPSIPYFLNPWPRLYAEFMRGPEAGDVPEWFDMRPIYELRELHAFEDVEPEPGELLGSAAWH